MIARTRGIPLAGGIERAATELKRSNTLIGTALGLLTVDPANQEALKTSLGTMRRVLDTVVWEEISKDDPDAWLYFYEHFLEVYDNALRKRTGSYYTPPEVVNAMVRLVDEALRGPLFERPLGLAAGEVTVADPAVGTGTFLLGVLRRIAGTVEADLGPGAVPGAITAAAGRLIGFELQFGPFAVAQLRLIAELQALMKVADEKVATLPALKLYITDALANPYIEQEEWIPQIAQPIAKSRRDANAIKRNQPITVVIGNPPYKTARFARDLVQPGLRVPLTADAALFARAASLGREVVWLHCYGERFHDAGAGRPKGPPRLSPAEAPTIPADGAIPGAPEPLPDALTYDAATQRLAVGAGRIDRVTPAMWAYEVSGKQVLWQWFSYRRRDRTRPVIGDRRKPSPLDAIQPESWLPDYTEDLMNLLHVLGRLVRLEPAQAALLDEVLDSPLIALEVLRRHADHEADSKRRHGAQ